MRLLPTAGADAGGEKKRDTDCSGVASCFFGCLPKLADAVAAAHGDDADAAVVVVVVVGSAAALLAAGPRGIWSPRRIVQKMMKIETGAAPH